MSILVVALNPSIDVEWKVDDVRWEEKNVIESERRWPGGKGVNVARWLHFFKVDATLVVPTGGEAGEELCSGLIKEGIRLQAVHIEESTRANIIVTTRNGRQLRFNPRGPKLAKSEAAEILRVIKRSVPQSSTMVLSGSLPRGSSPSAYKRILQNNSSARVLLDCDGEPFAKAVFAKPFLVKPNEYELSQWAGRTLTNEKSIVIAARKLSLVTGNWVFVSRGKDGAILVNGKLQRCLTAKAPKMTVKNTVGAGDALLAAVATKIDQDDSPRKWIQRGVATGCAAASCEAGTLPTLSLIRKLETSIDVTEKRI